ncbi:outer membrane beta-barrel protein [Hymenobacter caeli]|uniref:Outer membrane protein beta-barrel domain-containing protein n=1 Tax=Hymenobacter caeli TaxID=2735894 RepID=A0ABX2FWV1_9BACT|nr:outer membrane beta-barrel protein [Hymenobacter caeli]NRT20840.1 hypothetical protein [Hymenobacter caeli]
MQLHRFLLPGLLAGALPLAGFAQTKTPADFKPHVFVGLGASVGSLQSPARFYDRPALPSLTVGVQLQPRLAVQASALYAQSEGPYAYPSAYFNGGPHQGNTYGSIRQRRLVVPVLARYALTNRPEKRFQVDLLGGFTVARFMTKGSSTSVDSLQNVVSNYDGHYASTSWYLNLGTGVRYRLTQRLDLTGDFIVNFYINPPEHSGLSSYSYSTPIGLRYRFGRR